MTEGGIDWHIGRGIRDEFERFKVGQRGPFVVWGFRSNTLRTAWETPFAAPHLDPSKGSKGAEAFWEAWRVLTSSGLVEMVAHLVEATTDEAEAIHPLAVDNGEEGERAIRTAACKAARTMITDGQYEWALEQGVSILVPVRTHMANVQVVGIARLRYRPRTRATAIWRAKATEWAEWVSRYEAMTGDGQQREHATSR
jgi:hypothetical protein